jgi:type II secretory pathway component GspD/PulD (secretin)
VTTQSTTTASLFPTGAGGIAAFPFATQDSFTFGTLDFSQFQAVLELIKSRSDTDIVSNPTIATLNNTEALINVGETLNLPKYERNSTTGKMEITGYEAKDLGIILKVTPHVNDNGEIVVDLAPAISDLLRYDTLDKASGIVAPVWSIRQAKTQVMIKDGDTIFIGGLIKENNIDVKKKLPFLGDMLGDVPYVGLLVSRKETVKKKTELIFFMTVNLMTAGKEIKNVPQANKAYVPLYQATQVGEVNPKKKIKRTVSN